MKNLIHNTRTSCIITGSDEIENLFTIKKFPIFIGNTSKEIKNDLFSEIIFDISKKCGVIQLRNTINPNLIYSSYHSEAIGKVWEEHHLEFSKLISEIINKNQIKRVLEIGGSTAKIAKIILEQTESIESWTIIEPNTPSINENIDKRINFISEFFNDSIVDSPYDLILHSHTIEHMYEPNDFLISVNKSLSPNGYHIFSVPNLFSYLNSKFVNTLNFEHTIFLTEEILDYLMNRNNLEILDKKKYMEHSIFYVTKKNENVSPTPIPQKYEEYKTMFLNYIDFYKKLIDELNNRMIESNSDIYLFGAHVFSQFLISMGLNTEKIICVLDNSLIKNNTRLYGTNLTIKNPKEVNLKDNSIIILKVGNYRDEIISGLMSINSNIILWE
jgi:hypothetical protein